MIGTKSSSVTMPHWEAAKERFSLPSLAYGVTIREAKLISSRKSSMAMMINDASLERDLIASREATGADRYDEV